jgi:hypothetical protein
MVPMAIPSFGGMVIEVLTMLVVPVLYSTVKEFRRRTGLSGGVVGILIVGTAYVGLFAMAAYCAACDLRSRLRRRREASAGAGL